MEASDAVVLAWLTRWRISTLILQCTRTHTARSSTHTCTYMSPHTHTHLTQIHILSTALPYKYTHSTALNLLSHRRRLHFLYTHIRKSHIYSAKNIEVPSLLAPLSACTKLHDFSLVRSGAVASTDKQTTQRVPLIAKKKKKKEAETDMSIFRPAFKSQKAN